MKSKVFAKCFVRGCCFDEFFFLRDNWKTLLFLIVYRYSEIVLTAMLFETSVLKELRILCVISTLTDTNTKVPR